jgi:curved DNA-binding protein
MKYKDYYAVLGVQADATLEDIKKAYRLLAKAHHPDMSKASGAEDRFKEAAEAYACLKNPEKRAAYDALGKVPAGQGFSPTQDWEQQFSNGQGHFDGMDLADLLASLNAQSHRSRDANTPHNGKDQQDAVHISLADSVTGCRMNFSMRDGDKEKHIEVNIPAGIRQGQKVRLKGMGGQGRNGGRNGDIYLHVELLPHLLFKPVADDLYFELAVTPWEAVLGAEIEIPTLQDSVMLTLAPGTRHGQKLRIKGKGLPAAHQQRGDLFALVHLETPPVISAQDKLHYQALADASTFNPRSTLLKEAQRA